MTIKERVERGIADRALRTQTYEIPLSDEDMDLITTHDALQAPDIVETLVFRLQKLTGVTEAKIGVCGIRITVHMGAHSGTWHWIEHTIINYLREASFRGVLRGGTHDRV